MEINSLVDLNGFRSAPQLNLNQSNKLFKELQINILNSDWITVGIMASNDLDAINALQSISRKFSKIQFNGIDSLHAEGNVFLKGNQKTGDVYIRSENGLGEGILLTCQYDNKALTSNTYGPFPLDFFSH